MSNQHLQHAVDRQTSANNAAVVTVTGPAKIMGVTACYDSDPTAAQELSLVFNETGPDDIYIWVTKGGPAPIPLHGHLRVPSGNTCVVTLPADASAKGTVIVYFQEGASA